MILFVIEKDIKIGVRDLEKSYKLYVKRNVLSIHYDIYMYNILSDM